MKVSKNQDQDYEFSNLINDEAASQLINPSTEGNTADKNGEKPTQIDALMNDMRELQNVMSRLASEHGKRNDQTENLSEDDLMKLIDDSIQVSNQETVEKIVTKLKGLVRSTESVST